MLTFKMSAVITWGAICLLLGTPGFAQENTMTTITIQGVIQDISHNNLPGVVVTLKKINAMAITNGDGEFTLTAKVDASTGKDKVQGVLVLTHDGHARKEVAIKDVTQPVLARMKPIVNNTGLTTHVASIPGAHSLGWIHGKLKENTGKALTDEVFAELVKKYGKEKDLVTRVRVYLPKDVRQIKAAFLISEHGMGSLMMEHEIFRDFADKYQLALVGVFGDAIQRGIGPASALDALLTKIGATLKHPELGSVPVFTFGHSNGTGFSAFYAALRSEKVIGWISYHSGGSWHLIFPGVEDSPGLVMAGQKDSWFNNGQEQAVKDLRSKRDAPVTMMIEGQEEHWPSVRASAFTFILAYCEACIRIRFPDGKITPQATLIPAKIHSGWLGANYDRKAGGMQTLDIAPYEGFNGDKRIANWLPDETFARIWQHYGKTGKIAR